MNYKFLLFIFILSNTFFLNIASAKIICQYASFADSSSEQSNYLAEYATGRPDSNKDCSFSTKRKSWAPKNWRIPAILDLSFDIPLYPINLTIFGDQGITWSSIQLLDDARNSLIKISNFSSDCIYKKVFKQNLNFKTSKLRLIKTAWDWSATDAVEICGSVQETNYVLNDFITICNWKQCKRGAASISIDDGYSSCIEELENNGFRGTYFLSNTNKFSDKDWNKWEDIYKKGHEIGGHTRNHYCRKLNEKKLRFEIKSNIDDIVSNTNIPRSKLISFAWPCGVTDEESKKIVSDYYLSARGYHLNKLEEKNPSNFMELNSLNTPYFHDPELDPPNYLLMADEAELKGKWVNFVFHNECEDDGVISYLKNKNLWVEPIGEIIKYIKERQNTKIYNLTKSSNIIEFQLNTPSRFLLNKELTLKLSINPNSIKEIRVNDYKWQFSSDYNATFLNIIPSKSNKIKIYLNNCYSKNFSCNNVNSPVYIIPYMGDIDGSVSEDWFFFYKKLADFHIKNNISLGASFFPGTLVKNTVFTTALLNMYNSSYIELIQKGYLGDKKEYNMDILSFNQQKLVINTGKNKFREWLESNKLVKIHLPETYDQIGARFTKLTRKALEETGFKSYFDVYVASDLTPVQSSDKLDVIQYGLSLINEDNPGRESTFKQPSKIIEEINNFNSKDSLKINGFPIIPLWAHQQDFEDNFINNKLNKDKWSIYQNTLLKLKNDKNVNFLTPIESYNLRHKKIKICEYANFASASSENLAGSKAEYAIGKPDAPKSNKCASWSDWSGYGFSWTPSNWNKKSTLLLRYGVPIYVENLTVFGDYDICWNSIKLRNSNTLEEKIILNGINNDCIFTKNIEPTFKTDMVILETCGWSWSATDAVEICGMSFN